MSNVRFQDLRVSDPAELAELLAAVETVLRHGELMLGPELARFESAVAAHVGRRFAIGVGSGTAALDVALRALELQPGDEVITTPLSFIATTNAVRLNGATPVFADVGDDLNIDPAGIEKQITPRTRAILPVHLNGKVCRMEAILEVADRHGLPVIEDASQAFGAKRHGKFSGTFSKIGCFSLNPMKGYSALGEAGVILTDDAAIDRRLRELRYNGFVDKIECRWISPNSHLDTIQAAALLVRLPRLAKVIGRRVAIAARYRQALGDLVTVPVEDPGCLDVYYHFIVETDRRDELGAFLAERGVETRVRPAGGIIPDHFAYRDCRRGEYAVAAAHMKRMLAIPAHDKLTDEEVGRVIEAICTFFRA